MSYTRDGDGHGVVRRVMGADYSEVRELQSYLETKRDQRLYTVNLLGIAVGGVGGTTSAALSVNHTVASAVVGIVTGSATTALSLAGLKMRHGSKEYLKVPSNMLGELFDGPSASNNVYPSAVVAFMSTPEPDDPQGMSREDRLIQIWVDVGRIPPPETAKGREKIANVTSMPSENVKQEIADLEDRQAMLYDFRARLTYMKRDLEVLLGTLSTQVPMPFGVPAASP
jgi:hypothetical protein